MNNNRQIAKQKFDEHFMFKDNPIAWTAWKMVFQLGIEHQQALRQPLVSGRSEQLVDFVRWLNEKSYWVRIPDKVVEEYEQYLLYQQKKSTNCH